MLSRSLCLALPLIATALAIDVPEWMNDDNDWRVALGRDATADDYKDRGIDLPAIAKPVTTVEESQSYIIKLECPGCPSRVRQASTSQSAHELWEDVVQDTSLLLNFTIAEGNRSLLLNGETILPLESRPPDIFAFQTGANLTADFLQAMIALNMLDQDYQLRAKYLRYGLGYEHTTTMIGNSWLLLQFDVLYIDLVGRDPYHYFLDRHEQKTAQIQIADEPSGNGLSIKSVELIARNDKAKSTDMISGKSHPVSRTKYLSSEWDHYGKKGTALRTIHVTLRWLDHLIADCLPVIIMLLIALVVGLPIRWCVIVRRRADGRFRRAEEAKTQGFKGQDLKVALEKGGA